MSSWMEEYKRKLMSPHDAVRCVESGMRVYIQGGCAEPETLVECLMERAPYVRDVEIVHMLTFGSAPYVAPEMQGHFRHNAMFIGGNVREAVNEGRADYTPIYLSEIEGVFESGEMPIDVALVQVSPPDAHGFCSLGIGVDTTMTAIRCAKFSVAQVNNMMPRTYGDSFVHVSKFSAFVESTRQLCEMPKDEVTDLNRAIARNVAAAILTAVCIRASSPSFPAGHARARPGCRPGSQDRLRYRCGWWRARRRRFPIWRRSRSSLRPRAEMRRRSRLPRACRSG